MSYLVQTSLNVTEMNLFAQACEGEESNETQDSSMPDQLGKLTSEGKNYSCMPLKSETLALLKQEARDFLLQMGSTFREKMGLSEKQPSLMQMAEKTAYRPPTAPTMNKKADAEFKQSEVQPQKNVSAEKKSEQDTLLRTQSSATSSSQSTAVKTSTPTMAARSHSQTTVRASESHGKLDARNEKKDSNPLVSRQWSKEEPSEWWETRYDQRERQGEHRQHKDEQDQPEEEKNLRVSKSASSASKNPSTPTMTGSNQGNKVRKPALAPPKMGVFALYYILTKMGIQSDGVSNFSNKKEIELVDSETTEIHKKRLESMREAINKEQEAARWSVATKVFSWIGSLIAIISGVVLIATGVGAVAGAMMIIGGIIQITNQILEVTGGWKKIAELLPGEDSQKKGAVVAWMQIGIAVLCLILSGVGVVWGGFSVFSEAMQVANACLGGIATIGGGITQIGYGVNAFMFNDKMGDVKQYEYYLAKLKHSRKDLMEKVEWGVDRLEKLFEDLAKSLEFEEEIFHADQMLYRR